MLGHTEYAMLRASTAYGRIERELREQLMDYADAGEEERTALRNAILFKAAEAHMKLSDVIFVSTGRLDGLGLRLHQRATEIASQMKLDGETGPEFLDLLAGVRQSYSDVRAWWDLSIERRT